MKKRLIRQISDALPSHPNPVAALVMLYWIFRSDPQLRVIVNERTLDDLRVFISGIFSMTVKSALMMVLSTYHEECFDDIQVDMAFPYADLSEFTLIVERYIAAVRTIKRDSQDRVHFRTIALEISKASTSIQEQELSLV